MKESQVPLFGRCLVTLLFKRTGPTSCGLSIRLALRLGERLGLRLGLRLGERLLLRLALRLGLRLGDRLTLRLRAPCLALTRLPAAPVRSTHLPVSGLHIYLGSLALGLFGSHLLAPKFHIYMVHRFYLRAMTSDNSPIIVRIVVFNPFGQAKRTKLVCQHTIPC